MTLQLPKITKEFTKILEGRLHNWPRLLQIVIGPRQVGKTTGVKQVYEQWKGPKHFATADTPLPPTAEWIIQQWNRVRSVQENSLLVIDEIQKIDRWSEVVKKLFDEDRDAGKIRVILLGSASLDLTRGLSDSLAGRYEIIPVSHWSFFECHKAFGWSFEQCLMFGGYPGAAPLIEEPNRWQDYIANNIIGPVIHRDIPALQDIRKPALFRQVFELALSYPAQEISFQKLLGQLQESGNASTVKHYLEILSQAFLITTLEKYSTRSLSTKTSSPKIIPLCPALISAIASPTKINNDREWRGRVLESCIGAQLLHARGKLTYWREGKHEVDFVLERNNQLIAFEVKSNAKKPVGGLNAFISNFKGALAVQVDEQVASKLLLTSDVDTFIDRELLKV
jgi:predicted AAA+ superfamily ATPase